MRTVPKIFLALILLLLTRCGDRLHRIADVTKSETIALKKGPKQEAVHTLIITGSGQIDGEAEIFMIVNDEPYKTEKLSGAVYFDWSGDWYSDEAVIRYKPAKVTGGYLELQYGFRDM